jgi:hypothetical protein
MGPLRTRNARRRRVPRRAATRDALPAIRSGPSPPLRQPVKSTASNKPTGAHAPSGKQGRG